MCRSYSVFVNSDIRDAPGDCGSHQASGVVKKNLPSCMNAAGYMFKMTVLATLIMLNNKKRESE